jgi:hypothetical protein
MSTNNSKCFCCGKTLGPKQLRRHLLKYQGHRGDLSLDPIASDVEMVSNVGLEEPGSETHKPEGNEGMYCVLFRDHFVVHANVNPFLRTAADSY